MKLIEHLNNLKTAAKNRIPEIVQGEYERCVKSCEGEAMFGGGQLLYKLAFDEKDDRFSAVRAAFLPRALSCSGRENARAYAKLNELKEVLKKHDMLIGGCKNTIQDLKRSAANCRKSGDRESLTAIRCDLDKARDALEEAIRAKDETIRQVNFASARASAMVVDYGLLNATDERMSADRELRQAEIKRLGYGPNNKRRDEVPRIEYAEDTYENVMTKLWDTFYTDMKSLDGEFQDRGLISDIRGKIKEAVEKMSFQAGKYPSLKDITHTALYRQIKKKTGKPTPTFDEISKGGYGLHAEYLGSGFGQKNDCHLYHVRQEVGTRLKPRKVEYDLLVHRPFPSHAQVQGWTLSPGDKPYVTPIVSLPDLKSASSKSYVTNDYSTGRSLLGGSLLVATFVGEFINEEVTLPRWLVESFQRIDAIDSQLAESAGVPLRSLELSERGNKIQTVRRSDRPECVEWVHSYEQAWYRRNRLFAKARRCREAIFKTAAARIARLHTHLIEDPVDLAALKRNLTRDRRRDNALSVRNRRNFQVAAPGELRRILRQSSLDRSIKVTTESSSRTCSQRTYQS